MKILITRHDKIGDFITMLPVCKVLKDQTSHTIVILVAKVNVELAQSLSFIDDVIEYTEDKKALLQTIKSYHFDVSISGYIDMALGKILFQSKIPKRIAPATKMAQLFFNKRIKQRRSEVKMREFEYNLQLLKALDSSLFLDFERPLLEILSNGEKKDFIIFHVGFGGSSEGNLNLNDYLKLAKKASLYIKVVFSFGPDDLISKEYIKTHLDFEATLKDDFKNLMEFTKYIAKSKLFVSTSTGPMHLAGLTNTSTVSFFGEKTFASAKRWGTISCRTRQHNFTVKEDYGDEVYHRIEKKLLHLLNV